MLTSNWLDASYAGNNSCSGQKLPPISKYHEGGGTSPVTFSGPDARRDLRRQIRTENRYVGEGPFPYPSPEVSSEVCYLWRGPKRSSAFYKPKHEMAAEIGWGVADLHKYFASNKTGAQIKLKTFRKAVEDRHNHLYQEPWYPAPTHRVTILPETVYACSKLHDVPNPYEPVEGGYIYYQPRAHHYDHHKQRAYSSKVAEHMHIETRNQDRRFSDPQQNTSSYYADYKSKTNIRRSSKSSQNGVSML